MKAALYLRISQDREGKALGVARQEKACRSKAGDLGAEVTAVYTDNDITAADPDVRRPDFERLLCDVAAKKYDSVIAYSQGRLVRQNVELERIMYVFGKAHCAFEATTGKTDFDTAHGRLTARLFGSVDAFEVEQMKERLELKLQELAESGAPQPGRFSCYGYNPDKVTFNDEEAALVREAADRTIAGDGLRTICADWNRRGLRRRNGTPWVAVSIRQVLLNPTVAALRHRRRVIVAPGQWPPLLDRETWETVCRILLDPRRSSRKTGPQPTYLLSSWLICSLCGGRMHAYRIPGRARGYKCGECRRTTLRGDWLEDYVVGEIAGRLDSAAFMRACRRQSAQHGQDKVLAQLAAIERRVTEASRMFAEGKMQPTTYEELVPMLEEQMVPLRDKLDEIDHDNVLATLSPWAGQSGVFTEAWAYMTVPERQTVLRLLITRITILPSDLSRPNVFQPERVLIAWAA